MQLEVSALIIMLLWLKVKFLFLQIATVQLRNYVSLHMFDIPGALVGNRVRCPFHGACFNIKTGDIEEYPGLDSLPCHKVK